MCKKIVVETDVTSRTGKYLYSDMYFEAGKFKDIKMNLEIEKKSKTHYHGILNKLVRYPVIGIVAAICRLALSIIHIFGHLMAAAVTHKKGHLYHATKGFLEMQRAIIESIPVIGRIFAFLYSYEPGPTNGYYINERLHSYEINGDYWWLMKIYNPKTPDPIDSHNNLWVNVQDQKYRYIRA